MRILRALDEAFSRWMVVGTLILFLVSAVLHVHYASAGWNHSLIQAHAFRQTQTAISAYYLKKDGWRMDYPTPLLGPPWSIPFEFPLYQLAVAQLSSFANYPLDQSGRAVSLAFFILGLAALYGICREMGLGHASSLMTLSLCLASPLYLGWSASFMIESTAWAMANYFLWLGLRAWRRQSMRWAAAACLVGLISAVVKITTFFIAAAALSLFIVYRFRHLRITGTAITGLIFLLIVPLAGGIGWTRYADSIKARNPLSARFMSGPMTEWNFGTVHQRLKPVYWKVMQRSGWKQTMGVYWPLALLLIVGAASLAGADAAGIFLLVFLMGPLVFGNLYFTHNYYYFASGSYLLLAVGCSLDAFFRRGSWWSHAAVISVAFLWTASWGTYARSPVAGERTADDHEFMKAAGAVREVCGPDEVVIIIGDEWNARMPYYAERRAVMLNPNQLAGPGMRERLEALRADGVAPGALVIFGPGNGAGAPRVLPQDFKTGLQPIYRAELCSVFRWPDVR